MNKLMMKFKAFAAFVAGVAVCGMLFFLTLWNARAK